MTFHFSLKTHEQEAKKPPNTKPLKLQSDLGRCRSTLTPEVCLSCGVLLPPTMTRHCSWSFPQSSPQFSESFLLKGRFTEDRLTWVKPHSYCGGKSTGFLSLESSYSFCFPTPRCLLLYHSHLSLII